MLMAKTIIRNTKVGDDNGGCSMRQRKKIINLSHFGFGSRDSRVFSCIWFQPQMIGFSSRKLGFRHRYGFLNLGVSDLLLPCKINQMGQMGFVPNG